MKVLPVGQQAIEQLGLGGVQGGRRPDNGVPRSSSPSARPVVLHSVAQELSVFIHPHRHGQLVVLQVGQELLFVCRRKERREKEEAMSAPQGHSTSVRNLPEHSFIPWELCESLLRLWKSEAAITTRLSVQVSVFHKISILQGKL